MLFSGGDLFRSLADNGDRRALSAIANGDPIPIEIYDELLSEWLCETRPRLAILDGSPRNIEQARYLHERFNRFFAAVLEVEDKTARERLLNRAHQSETIRRTDDLPDAINRRIERQRLLLSTMVSYLDSIEVAEHFPSNQLSALELVPRITEWARSCLSIS
jgi:adenylate kinase family enzyme